MCRICVEWNMGMLSNKEALKNALEMSRSPSANDEDTLHYAEVIEKALEKLLTDETSEN